jgi:hypothetical protein
MSGLRGTNLPRAGLSPARKILQRESPRRIRATCDSYVDDRAMSKQKISYKHRIDRERAERFKHELLAAHREIAALKGQLSERYNEGSAEAFALFFAAISHHLRLFNYITAEFEAHPPPLPPKAATLVRELVAEAGKLAMETTGEDIIRGIELDDQP